MTKQKRFILALPREGGGFLRFWLRIVAVACALLLMPTVFQSSARAETDSDEDGWSDSHEVLTSGTSPLIRDTDAYGALDPYDVDPLRNLLVRVYVKGVHTDTPLCTPILAAVVQMNDDHTWVTGHQAATLHARSTLCGTIYTTVSCYYADVPDDVASVEVRASG